MAIPRSLGNFAAYADASSNGPTINGLNAGKGPGQVAYNTVFGFSAGTAVTTGNKNTLLGYTAGTNLTTALENTALGFQSGYNVTGGSYNTLVGENAGFSVTTGQKNTVIGLQFNNSYLTAAATNQFYAGTYDYDVLTFTTTAGTKLDGITAGFGPGRINTNVAFGNGALDANTTGASNVSIGRLTLNANTIGYQNTSVGSQSGQLLTTGNSNTFVGYLCGFSVTTGSKSLAVFGGDTGGSETRLSAGSVNIASIGTADYPVLYFSPTTGTKLDSMVCGFGLGRITTNVAVGTGALDSNTTGASNVSVGRLTLNGSTVGYQNTVLGSQAGQSTSTGYNNTFVGYLCGYSVTTGAKNISIYGGDTGGAETRLTAGSTGIISIGNADAERIRVNTDGFLVPLAYSQTSGSAANMYIDSTGKMFRSTSSARYKKNIQDAVHNLSDVLKLRSVTFNHINPDEDGILYGGLIAEEVHDAGLTEFVEYTWDGRPDGVRYGHMVSLLVKAVQELNAKVVALESR